MKDHTGLSIGYRTFWRLNYVGVTFFGPAQGRSENDPRTRLRLERAERVADAYRERNQPVPAEVQAVLDAHGKRPEKPRKVSTKERGPFALYATGQTRRPAYPRAVAPVTQRRSVAFMRIAIAGAHGKIARLLTKRLVSHGHDVVGIIRQELQCGDITSDGAEPVVLSLEEASADEVAAAITGCDAVVFAAGGGPTSGRARKWTVDLGGAVLLADAAEIAGVSRYVMVSSIGAGTPEMVEPGTFQVHLYAKGGADADLRAREGLAWTIVRPGRLTDGEPTGKVSAGADVPRGDIPRADVADVLAATLSDDRTIGKTFVVTEGSTPIAEAIARV